MMRPRSCSGDYGVIRVYVCCFVTQWFWYRADKVNRVDGFYRAISFYRAYGFYRVSELGVSTRYGHYRIGL